MTPFLLNFLELSGAKICTSCRSRQELSNEYLLAKFGVDTAENEPLLVWRMNKLVISLLSDATELCPLDRSLLRAEGAEVHTPGRR